jgi:hypothetical protein
VGGGMTFVGGGSGVLGPMSALRFSQTRGRIQGAASGVSYPSPFFDVGHTYLPGTVKQLFRWCRYYFLTNPLINAIVFKLSEYPITDFIIDHPSKEVVTKYTDYLNDQLNYRPFQIEFGLDYHTYGNGLCSLSFPFKKFLRCRACQFSSEANKIRPHWTLVNFEFRLVCPKCGHTGPAESKDVYFRNPSGIRLMRWNPEDVEITYSDLTGEYTYYYTIPGPLKNDVILGKKEVVENVPEVFISALREHKGVVFSKDLFFHLRRPTLADHDRGWGIPLLLPVLKDAFYLQLMKKSQEAILLEHIVPLRILFPQAGSGTSDPYSTVNLLDWRDHVATEIARWRLDPNYIPIMPLPVGNQTIGGDGRALMLTQEIQIWSEQIINGCQLPLEFIKGGLSYAGTNVSMRMLENQFLGYLSRHRQMGNWILRQIAAYLDWPVAKLRFRPFKMADDIQRKAYLFQLNQAGKISDTTLLTDADLSQEKEDEMMIRETALRMKAVEKQQLAMAELSGKQQIVAMKMTAKAQEELQKALGAPEAPGEPGGPDGAGALGPMQSPLRRGQDMGMNQAPAAGGEAQLGGSSLLAIAARLAAELGVMDPASQHVTLGRLRKESPELADLVLQFLAGMGGLAEPERGGRGQGGAGIGIDLRPLPEKLPPRRAAQVV